MADYSQYQGPNPEWEEFVRVTNIPPAGLAPGQTPADLRRATNAGRVTASKTVLEASGLLDKVSWHDADIPTQDHSTVPARIYKPKGIDSSTTGPLPVYLFFHGGGYLFGSLDTEDAACARVVAMSPNPVIVVHVNYRHTPDFRYPTQHNDAWDAFLWLGKNIASIGGDPKKVIVGGISAGGGLTAAVVLRAAQDLNSGDTNLTIIGQLLLIPWILHPKAYPFEQLASKERSSWWQNEHAPVLPHTQINMFLDVWDSADTDPTDIFLSPVLAPDDKVKGIPKTVVVAAGMDPLRDEALLYADKLKRNGVPTKVHVFPGLPHGFRRFETLKASRRWDEVIVEGIQWCLSDNRESSTKVEL
ncbi:uncharacterized protein Z520_06488 [Fonsecaea multimorphosa CBS 102226]|uniref:Alpha/beta hydrolase fold-3 domain-containing protein n=1 Tax=Fonsecaea multimorphosa CBS 102226 TaxID=1442371 RepID=A0A0D2H777_9EURO|nr:uncharacterized protein Z520_06488 [Fonsecaea multimorphosa CBS 102226]KIX97710.1 hypothetical protein Z520_06488 [Fonsecaea multimorphosa CBS 102226]OAL23874.1 hypothetical protein AYO22_06050 [Fonsecaea multimorphosa]